MPQEHDGDRSPNYGTNWRRFAVILLLLLLLAAVVTVLVVSGVIPR